MNTLTELLLKRATQTPNDIAYKFLDAHCRISKQFTYRKLLLEVQQRAKSIENHCKSGDRVLLIYPPGLDFIIAFFAVISHGAIPVPVQPPLTAELERKLNNIIVDCEPSLILPHKQFSRRKNIKANFVKTTFFKFILNKLRLSRVNQHLSKRFLKELKTVSQDDIAFLQYTSGSTSHPKGVCITHHNVMTNLKDMTTLFDTTSSNRFLTWLPHFHDMGLIGGILFPLFYNVSVNIMSPLDFLKKPQNWMQFISSERITAVIVPNFALDYCVNKVNPAEYSLDLSSLKLMFIGAEPIHANTLERFYRKFSSYGFSKACFIPCYGLAEATLMVSVATDGYKPLSVDPKAFQLGIIKLSTHHAKLIVNCGKPLNAIKILDPESLEECSVLTIGEICIAGENISQGYWHSKTDYSEFFPTGDLGFIHNNELYVTGRIKDLIIIRGENFYPHDIEYHIEQHISGIRKGRSIAFAKVQDRDESFIIAVEPLSSVQKKSYPQLSQKIFTQTAKQFTHYPHSVLIVEPGSIPKTSSGKLQHHQASHLFNNNELPILYSFQPKISKTPTAEKNICRQTEFRDILSALIHVANQIGNNSHLNLTESTRLRDTGLDSLQLVEFSLNIEKTYNIDLDVNWSSSEIDFRVLAQQIYKSSKTSFPTKPDDTPSELLFVKPNFIQALTNKIIERISWLRISLINFRYKSLFFSTSMLPNRYIRMLQALNSLNIYNKPTIIKRTNRFMSHISRAQLMQQSSFRNWLFNPKKYFPDTFNQLRILLSTTNKPQLFILFHMAGWYETLHVMISAILSEQSLSLTIIGDGHQYDISALFKSAELYFGRDWSDIDPHHQIHFIDGTGPDVAQNLMFAVKQKHLMIALPDSQRAYNDDVNVGSLSVFNQTIKINTGVFKLAELYELPVTLIRCGFRYGKLYIDHQLAPAGESCLAVLLKPFTRSIEEVPEQWFAWDSAYLIQHLITDADGGFDFSIRVGASFIQVWADNRVTFGE